MIGPGATRTAVLVAAIIVLSCAARERARATARHGVETPASAREATSGERARTPVVILTIDGVRWQEIFEGTDPTLSEGRARVAAGAIVPNLYRLGTERGAFLGAPGLGTISATGPEYVSLPGYSEIFSGRADHGCANNECPRTTRLTWLDEAHARGAKVGAFASWSRLDRALTANPGDFVVSCGPRPNVAAAGEQEEVRSDAATADLGLAFLREEHPDVLYLGLGEPDDFAHAGDYAGYVDAIRRADAVLGRLLEALDRDERGRKTDLFVMPDHGRANDFRSHGGYAPEAARVWLVAGGPSIRARGFIGSPAERHLSDIGPTVQALLGLPRDSGGPGVGSPLIELLVQDDRRLGAL